MVLEKSLNLILTNGLEPWLMSLYLFVYVSVCVSVLCLCLCMSVSLYVCLSVSVDSCKKSAVVFDEAIASFDIINCQSVQSQVPISVCLAKYRLLHQELILWSNRLQKQPWLCCYKSDGGEIWPDCS